MRDSRGTRDRAQVFAAVFTREQGGKLRANLDEMSERALELIKIDQKISARTIALFTNCTI